MHSIRVKNCWNWLIRTRSKVKLDREQFLFIISFSTLICFLKTVYKHTYIYIYIYTHIYIHLQFSSVTQSCLTLCNPLNHSMLGLPVHHQLPEFTQTHVHQVGDAIQHLILCHPRLLLPPIPPRSRVFSNESALRMRWPKYWSFSLSISPSNEHPGLISFRMDWLALLAVQGTLKSFSNTTVQKHQFFTVQFSHPYRTTGKTIAFPPSTATMENSVEIP